MIVTMFVIASIQFRDEQDLSRITAPAFSITFLDVLVAPFGEMGIAVAGSAATLPHLPRPVLTITEVAVSDHFGSFVDVAIDSFGAAPRLRRFHDSR